MELEGYIKLIEENIINETTALNSVLHNIKGKAQKILELEDGKETLELDESKKVLKEEENETRRNLITKIRKKGEALKEFKYLLKEDDNFKSYLLKTSRKSFLEKILFKEKKRLPLSTEKIIKDFFLSQVEKNYSEPERLEYYLKNYGKYN